MTDRRGIFLEQHGQLLEDLDRVELWLASRKVQF